MNCELRIADWKKVLLLAGIMAGSVTAFATPVIYLAQNFYSMYGVTSAPLTNQIQIAPVTANAITLYGNKITTGPAVTITPDATGSNQFNLYPNSYRLTFVGLPISALYFNVYDTNTPIYINSNLTSGVGTYTWTNNNNFTVYGSPGDSQAGTLTEKIKVGSTLVLSTNAVGPQFFAKLDLATSNSYYGQYSGNGSNLYLLQGTSLVPGSGPIDTTLIPAQYVTNGTLTNFVYAQGVRSTNFSLFIGANITNFSLLLGSNATNNDALTLQAATNFSLTLGAGITNYDNYLFQVQSNYALALAFLNTNFTLQIAANDSNNVAAQTLALTNYVNLASNFLAGEIAVLGGGGVSYLIGNDIVLKNVNGTTRFTATQSGDLTMDFEDGTTFLDASTSHNIYYKDYANNNRLEIDNDGHTILRGSAGGDSFTITPNGFAQTLNAEVTDTAAWPMTTPGVLTNFFADVNNASTTETAANVFTIPANLLATNGDMLVRTFCVKLASGATTKRVRLYFGGNTIFDSTALGNSGAGAYSVRAELIRVDDTHFRSNVSATASAVSILAFSQYDSASPTTAFSTTPQDFHVTLTDSASSSQETVTMDSTSFYPASSRAAAQ
jgi:hypothetical protein